MFQFDPESNATNFKLFRGVLKKLWIKQILLHFYNYISVKII